jgi:Domain of unknown function (DUF1864)
VIMKPSGRLVRERDSGDDEAPATSLVGGLMAGRTRWGDRRIAWLDDWLRSTFVELNTKLEEAYFAAGAEFLEDPALRSDKHRILTEGAAAAGAINDLPASAADRYELLGMVGFVLGSCRRHEMEDAAVLAPVWAVARRIAKTLGVAPRYVFAHQAFFNTARDSVLRTFTTLPEEAAFVELNALGVLAYGRTAAALSQIPAMGVTHPIASHLLDHARIGLEEVLAANRRISKEISIDRFFRNIRPYFKSYRVGPRVYRGANAGDFAWINVIDVVLGLCDPVDPFYGSIVAEKIPFVPPVEQGMLRRLGDSGSLLARFEAEAREHATDRLRENARRYLAVCRAHGAAYAFHHHALVKPFVVRPSADTPPERRAVVTSSGPSLEGVISTLERLNVLRSSRAPFAKLEGLVA